MEKQNRHRFQRIDERLEALHAELALHSKKQHTVSDALFYEELQYQAEMCTHSEFQTCFQELRKISQSTPQVLYHLAKIIEILQRHLVIDTDDDVRTSLLTLIVALARDIGSEFYPHLHVFLDKIISVIDTSKPELSAEAFKAIIMLFKYNQTQLLTDINALRTFYAPLLGHSKEFVREFAAHAFAGLLRRLKTGKMMREFLVKFLRALTSGAGRDDTNLQHGVSVLLFCMMKNVQRQFHSRAQEILMILLDSFRLDDEDAAQALYTVVWITTEMMKQYTCLPNCNVVWSCLQQSLGQAIEAREAVYLGRQLEIFTSWIKFRRAFLVDAECRAQIYPLLLKLVSVEHESDLQEQILQLVYQFITLLNPETSELTELVTQAFQHSTIDNAFDFYSNLTDSLETEEIETHVVPQLLSTLFTNADSDKLLFMLKTISTKSSSLSLPKSHKKTLLATVEKIFHDKQVEQDEAKSGMALCALQCIQSITFTCTKAVVDLVKELTFSMNGRILRMEGMKTLYRIQPETLKPEQVMAQVLKYPESVSTLRMVCDYFSEAPTQEMLDVKLMKALQPNLRSPSEHIRLSSLELLTSFKQLDWIILDQEEATCTGECPILRLCLEIEQTKLSVSTERDISRRLDRLAVLMRSQQTPPVLRPLVATYILGIFHRKFSTIWNSATQTFAAAVERSFNESWPMIWNELEHVNGFATGEPAEVEQEPTSTASDSYCVQEWLNADEYEHSKSTRNCTDPLTYHKLVWTAMEKISQRLEGKSKVLMPMFLAFLRDQYYHIHAEETNRVSDIELSDALDAATEYKVSKTELSLTGKDVRQKLIQFLKFFALLNAQGIYRQDLLRTICFEFLIKTDAAIGKQAMACLLKFKDAYLVPYKASLMNILDDAQFREEMSTFDLEAVPAEHREPLIRVLSRITYAKFVTRKGKSSKDSLSTRRAAILAFLGQFEPRELQTFFELILRPFQPQVNFTVPDTPTAAKKRLEQLDLNSVDLSKQLGFLNLCGDIITQFGMKATLYLPDLLTIITAILSHVETSSNSRSREVRSLCFRRLTDIIHQFGADTALTVFMPILADSQQQSIQLLPNSMIGATQPSALLVFFGAIAKTTALVPLLEQYKIIPSVLDTLVAGLNTTTTDVGIPVIQAVLEFVAAILAYDEAVEGRKILTQWIPKLLDHFISRFSVKSDTFAADRRVNLSAYECDILCRISSYVTADLIQDGVPDKLTELLLPFLLHNRRVSDTNKEMILRILARLVPFVSNTGQHVTFLSTLLAPGKNCLETRSVREALVELFTAIGASSTSELKPETVELLVELNSYSGARIESIDFNRRLDALTALRTCNFSQVIESQENVLPIVSHLLEAMKHEEYTMRSAARKTVEKILDLPSTDLILQLVTTIVVPSIQMGLKLQSDVARQEFIALLATYTEYAKRFELPHADLFELRNTLDPEVDFFYNIAHIQHHRRARAISRLSQQLKQATTFSPSSLSLILIPILEHIVFEMSGAKEQNLITQATVAIGEAARLLPWSAYMSLLRNILRQIPRHQEKESVLIRTACSILDGFHFDAPLAASGWTQELAEIEMNLKDEETSVQTALRMKVVPMLEQYLIRHHDTKGKPNKKGGQETKKKTIDGQIVTIPIALALVKVYRRLPLPYFHAQLPKLLMMVIKFLKSRDEPIRVASRETLVRIAIELGPMYLYPIITELQQSLREGYMVHVLSFTLHAILARMVPLITPKQSDSPLDTCIHSIMKILMEDLFGEAGKAKDGTDSGFKSKMKEAKACKSLDTIELVAAGLSFLPSTSIHRVLQPVTQVLRETESTRTVTKARDVFRRIMIGLSRNQSVESSEMLTYVHSIFVSVLEERKNNETKTTEGQSNWLVERKEKPQRQSMFETFQVVHQEKMTGYDRHRSKRKLGSDAIANEYVIFALGLLQSQLRRGKLNKSEQKDQEYLDPFVSILVNLIASSKANPVIIGTLKCLSSLLQWPLPTWKNQLERVVEKMLDHIQSAAASTRNEIVQECFRGLTILLEERSAVLNDVRLQALLGFIRSDMEETDHQNTTFALLKAIVARRLIVSEMYDLMTRLSEKMIQSQSQSVQKSCRQILLSFLVLYPLEKKRFDRYLSVIVTNLGYTYETGRLAALDTIALAFEKLPATEINSRAEFFFLPLALRLTNETITLCRERVSKVIGILLRQLDTGKLQACFQYVLTWWRSDQLELVKLAAQVTRIEPKAIQSDRREITKIIHEQLAATSNDNEAWQIRYQLLTCLEKINSISWSWAPQLIESMTFPHTWVRHAATRLLKQYLDGAEKPPVEHVFPILVKLCDQLESDHLSQEYVDVILQCLSLITRSQLLCTEEEKDPIGWLFTRLSYLARTPNHLRKSTIFKWFAVMISRQEQDKYLLHMLNPLVREVYDEKTAAQQADEAEKEVQAIAQDTLALIEQKTEEGVYLEKLNYVQQKIAQARAERRQKRKQEAVSNPVKYARRKIHKNKSVRDRKKKRAMDYAIVRGRGFEKQPKTSRTAGAF